MPKRYHMTDDDIDLEIQEWFFDEGLVRMVVYPGGLDVEVTDPGMVLLIQNDAFKNDHPYNKIKYKSRRFISRFRIWLMFAVFILSAIVCFLL